MGILLWDVEGLRAVEGLRDVEDAVPYKEQGGSLRVARACGRLIAAPTKGSSENHFFAELHGIRHV